MDGVENIHELRCAPGKERTNVHLTDAHCFQQLAESYDSLCFESKLQDNLLSYLCGLENAKVGGYHVVTLCLDADWKEIMGQILLRIVELDIDKKLEELFNDLTFLIEQKSELRIEKKFFEIFRYIDDRHKIIIALPDFYDYVTSIPASDIFRMTDFMKQCKYVKFWLCGKSSWYLSTIERCKIFYRFFDPISFDYFTSVKAGKGKPVVYISYKWVGISLDIVDQLCALFRKKQISYKRDKEYCRYNDSITDFMKEIRDAKLVVIVFCREYFDSFACCYEMSGIFSHDDYKKRIVSIVVDEELRDDESWHDDIREYWTNKRSANRTKMEGLQLEFEEQKVPYREKEDIMCGIQQTLPKVFDYIADDNAMDLNYLADNDYMPVLQKVKDKLSEYYGNMV